MIHVQNWINAYCVNLNETIFKVKHHANSFRKFLQFRNMSRHFFIRTNCILPFYYSSLSFRFRTESDCLLFLGYLRDFQISRHLTARLSFAGQTAGAGGTPRLSCLPFK